MSKNQSDEDFDVVAERLLEIHGEDGSRAPIRIEFGRPEKSAEEGDYSCTYRISGIGASIRQRTIFGVDSLQALLLCIKAAGVDLSIAQEEHRITWPGTEHADSLLE